MKIKKLKSGIYRHRVPIYNQRLYVSVGRDAAVNHFGEDGQMAEEMAAGEKYLDDNGRFAILIIIGEGYANTNTIAHEAVHAAIDILDHVEVFYCAENQEPIAYLVGHIAEVIQACVDMEGA